MVAGSADNSGLAGPPVVQLAGPAALKLKARAKVNLSLSVGALRPDGYHDLSTVFHSIDLADTLKVRFSPRRPGTKKLITALDVAGLGAFKVPRDGGNLLWKGIEEVVAHVNQAARSMPGGMTIQWPEIALHLTKAIPTAGGMAGGSADGAAGVAAMAHYLAEAGLPLSPRSIDSILSALGSDVPFAYYGGTRWGTGRGVELTEIPAPHTFHFAFGFLKSGLSTPRVFSQLDAMRAAGEAPEPGELGYPEDLAAALIAGPEALAAAIVNDLQAPAIALSPQIGRVIAVGEAAGALKGFVSGSGPTTAFLCADEASAREVARAITGIADDVAVAASAATGVSIQDPDQGSH